MNRPRARPPSERPERPPPSRGRPSLDLLSRPPRRRLRTTTPSPSTSSSRRARPDRRALSIHASDRYTYSIEKRLRCRCHVYLYAHTVVYGNQGHLRVQKKTPACCAETSRFRATSSRQTSRGRSVVRDGRRRERERGPARRDDGRRSVDVVGTIDADVRGCDSRETRRSRGERARARGKRARGEDAGRGDDASNAIERRGEDRDE